MSGTLIEPLWRVLQFWFGFAAAIWTTRFEIWDKSICIMSNYIAFTDYSSSEYGIIAHNFEIEYFRISRTANSFCIFCRYSGAHRAEAPIHSVSKKYLFKKFKIQIQFTRCIAPLLMIFERMVNFSEYLLKNHCEGVVFVRGLTL